MTGAHPPAADGIIPVSVITGFLGSGKTTLLNHLLRHGKVEETAVLVNELGDVGLDHLLVETIDENIILLNAGCLCCSIRGDLAAALRDLFRRRSDGAVPVFKRVVVETTGLADPAPIIHTLMSDPLIINHFRLDGIITTVDGLLGAGQLDDHREAAKQAAVADRVVVTKVDLADAADVDRLCDRLRRLNPGADILPARHGEVAPDALFNTGLFDPRIKGPNVERWLREEAYGGDHGHDQHGSSRHDDHISAFCMTVTEPIRWDGFVTWLEMLLTTRGESLLRVKGILNVAGEDRPVAVHGVQHVFHPPATLPEWPEGERLSRLVFITRNLGRQAIEDTFQAIMADAGHGDHLASKRT